MPTDENPMPELASADRPVVVDLVGSEGRMLAHDLEQARVLLRDGMAKISSFVSVLQESVARAHQLANVTGERDAIAITRALSTIQADADQAMMGLQLEDILGQLIEGTQARVGAFSQLSTVKEGRERVVVGQSSLDAGDAELF